MNLFLISEDELKRKNELIRRVIGKRNQFLSVDAENELYGPAFSYYLIFSDRSLRGELDLPELTDSEIFYNQYRWFLLFSKLFQLTHGRDAGLEQQVFGLIEGAPSGINWDVMKKISDHVEEEVSKLL